MKANLKKTLGMAALGMTLLATTVPTWAGSVSTPGVFITWGPTYIAARGSLVGARYSADSTQMIGCYIDAAPFVSCSARDRQGTFAGCVSYDTRHVDAVQRMTDSSLIIFEMDRGNAACRTIRIYNKSYYLK